MSASDSGEWLTRKQAANYLATLGYSLSPDRLGKMAERGNAGGGPPFTKYSARVVRYRRSDLKDWLDARAKRFP